MLVGADSVLVGVVVAVQDMTQMERDEARWKAEEEEDEVQRAALELELKERQVPG